MTARQDIAMAYNACYEFCRQAQRAVRAMDENQARPEGERRARLVEVSEMLRLSMQATRALAGVRRRPPAAASGGVRLVGAEQKGG